jgi:SAM-dependent methyltransferase
VDSQNFDKYDYYIRSVQSPEVDVAFFKKVYKELKHKEAFTLREDFCGTFIVCQEWVKLGSKNKAIGVDLDSEPIEYGKKLADKALKPSQKSRLSILTKNVLSPSLPKSDMTVALNFSYYLFKERAMLKKYFRNVYKTLKSDGVFLLDCFGGSNCYEPNEEETLHKGYSYYWDQDSYDPLTSEGKFAIHFKLKGKKKMKNVFQYDWRLWSIPELREVLKEVGFKDIHVYWEGTTKKGEGDGVFKRVDKGEDCESWIAYLAATK